MIVWNAATAQPTRKLQGHKWQVTAVAAMPDGSIASASLDGWVPGQHEMSLLCIIGGSLWHACCLIVSKMASTCASILASGNSHRRLLLMDAGLSASGMPMAMRKCWRVTRAQSNACCSYLMAAWYLVRTTRLSESGRGRTASGRLLATTTQSGAILLLVHETRHQVNHQTLNRRRRFVLQFATWPNCQDFMSVHLQGPEPDTRYWVRIDIT